MTSYSTKIMGDRFDWRLEILPDGKPWGETFPGPDHFDLSVLDADTVLRNYLLLEDFSSMGGDYPFEELTWLPDTSMASDAGLRGPTICIPYAQLHHCSSRREYTMQMADALIHSYEDICRFLRRAEILAKFSTQEALQIVVDDLRTVCEFLTPSGEWSRLQGVELDQSPPDMGTCPQPKEKGDSHVLEI